MSPVIDVTVMKDSLLVYVLNFFRYFWSSSAELSKNIDTRLCSWLSDAARLTEVGGLNFSWEDSFKTSLSPWYVCDPPKKHNLSFRFRYLMVGGLFILWWWRVEGKGGGVDEILVRSVYVPDMRVRPLKHYFSFYFYKIWIGAGGRGRVKYFFSDSRVQSNFFLGEGGRGISVESRVQGPGSSEAFRKWLKNESKADRTPKVYRFVCPIFRLDKASLHQELKTTKCEYNKW